MRYKAEHDHHLASLISGHYDDKRHLHALAEGLSRLENDLHVSGKEVDKAAHEAAVEATIQEIDRLKRAWDREEAGIGSCGRGN